MENEVETRENYFKFKYTSFYSTGKFVQQDVVVVHAAIIPQQRHISPFQSDCSNAIIMQLCVFSFFIIAFLFRYTGLIILNDYHITYPRLNRKDKLHLLIHTLKAFGKYLVMIMQSNIANTLESNS